MTHVEQTTDFALEEPVTTRWPARCSAPRRG
jgi:hypothetical protein